MDVDIEQLRALMKAMNKHKLDGLELHQGEEGIVLRRNAPMLAAAPAIAAAAPIAAPEPKKSRSESADVSADQPGELITSPFVGTFYRAPNPTADPFVKEGGTFEQGQAICIVEAMKLMNEIEAEFSGKVLEILVENGKPVEYGDPLFRVEKT